MQIWGLRLMVREGPSELNQGTAVVGDFSYSC